MVACEQGTNAHALLQQLPSHQHAAAGTAMVLKTKIQAAPQQQLIYQSERLWITHLNTPLLHSYCVPNHDTYNLALDAMEASAFEAQEVQRQAEEQQQQQQEGFMMPHIFTTKMLTEISLGRSTPHELIVFECPLGLATLSSLAGMCITTVSLEDAEGERTGAPPGGGVGRADVSPGRAHLVPTALMLCLAKEAAYALAAASQIDPVMVLTQGLLLPQVRESASTCCLLLPLVNEN
jgi:hypothetical protein